LLGSIVAGAQPILLDEVDHAEIGKLRACLIAPCRAARADALRIQDVRDLGANVIFQEAVHQLDDLGSGLHLLRRRFWVLGRQRLGFPTFEADMDPGFSFGSKLEQCYVLDNVGEQLLAFAVWQGPDLARLS
jgi:hypothetical protein